jgi:hypothetical protein
VSTIVADADSLIKMGKSGALPALLSAARVLVPRAVWVEAVEEGKREMYEDAHVLERMLEEGGAEVVGHEAREEAEELLRVSSASFGAGERAALAAFFAHGADAVLTDDRVFLALLVGASPPVPALVPTAAIVALAEGAKMSVAEAKAALGKIEHSVRAEAYGAAMQELEKLEETEERKR